MNYVFALQFEYHRYQQDALIKIYVDNFLFDTIRLSKDIKLKTIADEALPPKPEYIKYPGPKNYSAIHIVPEKIFLFDIDERYLRRSIRIEVENDYNNHSNGYMTNFAYIRLHAMALMPDFILEQKNWSLFENFRDLPGKAMRAQNWPKTPYNDEIKVTSEKKEYKKGLYFMKKGGNFQIEVPLHKKHGIIHPGNRPMGKLYFAHLFPRQVLYYK
jgi:hypothetical protein|tara:strand:- start:53 stop:697 length:645 start_codon:yes stop_codon:yes gene_type:complete